MSRWLFWTDRHHIIKASLDGLQRVTFLSHTEHVYWPMSITLDHPTQTLYWIDAASKSIGKCHINGSRLQTLLSFNISNPSGLTVFENKVSTHTHTHTLDYVYRFTGRREMMV